MMALEVTLDEMLGKGSYGMVYRASTPRHGAVAVKVLPFAPHEVSNDLKKELKLLQRCNSAYIVRAYGAFAKPKELWICMEYCDLGSLLDVMRSMDEPMPEDAVASACCDSVRGLAYMHTQIPKRVIIHRDIKSANILFNSEGRVKLADFGVAAQLNSTASKRSSVIGTPHWMAPEVIQNGKYDARADVWSLGVTAMEMAQCHPPHHEMHPVLKVLFAIASGAPPQLEKPERFSETFVDFVATALVKEPADRPTSTELLKHAFLQKAERAPLLALAERALYFKHNPKSRRNSEKATLSRGESDATLQRQESGGTLDGSTINGGTFCARSEGGTADGGTFCARGGDEGGTAGGTFCARGDTAGAGGSTMGGTFCARGDTAGAGGSTMGGTFCARANSDGGGTMGGTFCAAGSTMGGTFCACDAAAAAAGSGGDEAGGGTLKAGALALPRDSGGRAEMASAASQEELSVGRASEGDVPFGRSLVRTTLRAMDDSQLDLLIKENHFDEAMAPPRKPIERAASDDALFARATSNFNDVRATLRSKKVPHPDSVEPEASYGDDKGGDPGKNCVIS